jgi:hypothetical protein
VLKDPGVKLHLIAVTKIESLATRALDFAFTSEEEEMGTIGMTGEVGDVGDSLYCASRPVLPSCQANVGRSYQDGHSEIRGALLISEFIYCIQ